MYPKNFVGVGMLPQFPGIEPKNCAAELERVSHLVSNVRILDSNASEVRVKSRFIVYRIRMVDEESLFIGKRIDTLRRVGRDWQIAPREIYLDQSVMLSKNFTVFF